MNVFDNITATEHVVAESSMLSATNGDGHIYSLKAHKALDNGSIVAKGDYVEDQIFNSKDYATGEKPLLVLTTPIAYNGIAGRDAEKYFYNAAGEIMRAYELHVGDIFTVSAMAISGSPDLASKNFVTVSSGLYAAAATDATSKDFLGKIIDKVNYSNSVSYRILVERV